jgi:hypothetical protein
MPLCPRCGAAHLRDAESCPECGKRLATYPRVGADQESLSFPTCVDGPDGCEGPPLERADGELRCTAHDLNTRLVVHRIPNSHPFACIDGPDGCEGRVSPRLDDQLRCDYHHGLLEKPGWRVRLRRWFRRSE